MASQDQALPGTGQPAPAFGESERAEPRNLAVKSAGELVDDHALRRVGNQAGKAGAELFSAAQNVKRTQPGRHVAEADRGQRAGHGVEVPGGRDCVDDGRVGGPTGGEIGDADAGPELAADGAFPGA